MGAIARAMGVTRNSIIGQSNRMTLQFHPGTQPPISPDAVFVREGRTRFPGRVKEPGLNSVLKPGSYNRKLGAMVTKGRWKGFPLWSLTLEERTTCPRSCKAWLTCYGNSSSNSIRYRHGAPLIAALENDLKYLQAMHPGGFVVRLHQLGDFPSVEYVNFWRGALDRYSALRIFGYTARLPDGAIGRAINALRDERWDRFAVRTSGGEAGPRTMIVSDKKSAPKGAIICPAQTGQAKCCAACALCWAIPAKERPVAFIQH